MLLVDDFAAILRCCPEFVIEPRKTIELYGILWILVRPSESFWVQMDDGYDTCTRLTVMIVKVFDVLCV